MLKSLSMNRHSIWYEQQGPSLQILYVVLPVPGRRTSEPFNAPASLQHSNSYEPFEVFPTVFLTVYPISSPSVPVPDKTVEVLVRTLFERACFDFGTDEGDFLSAESIAVPWRRMLRTLSVTMVPSALKA